MKSLSLSIVFYAALFVINFLYGNSITVTIQSLLGFVLIVVLVFYLKKLKDKASINHLMLEQHHKRLDEELEELKNGKS